MILNTNLAIGSTNFIETLNQVHHIDNHFKFNFQSISLHVMNNFQIMNFHDLIIAPHNQTKYDI